MKKYILPLLLLLSLGIAACRKCEDPCLKKSNAEFLIESICQDKWFAGDTVSGDTRFRPLHDADSFVWILGAQTIRGQNIVYKNSFPTGELSATLITYRQPQLDCDPDDDGIDTFTRTFRKWGNGTFYTTGTEPPFPIDGTYYGHLESNPSHEYYVRLSGDSAVRIPPPPLLPEFIQVLVNFPIEGLSTLDTSAYWSGLIDHGSPFAYYIEWESPYRYMPPTKGYAHLTKSSGRRQIRIEYSYQLPNGNWQPEVFVGRKLLY